MLKKIVIVLFLGFTAGVFAKEDKAGLQGVEVGDVYTIAEASAHEYQFINFEKRNLILKRGGTPDYQSVEGNKVKVTEVSTNKNGDVIVTLERLDGTKFYNKYKKVKANVSKAISSGELVQ